MDAKTRLKCKKAMRFILAPMKVLPIKRNRVLLLNRLTLGFAGNPKAVAMYLAEHYADSLDLVYAVGHPERYAELRKQHIRVIKFNSFAYFYNLMTCRVFLTNSGGYSYVPLRMNKQYVINLHHGFPYKKIGIDMYEETPAFREDMRLYANNTSKYLSPNKFFCKVLVDSCLIPSEIIWEVGTPRNDMLINTDDTMINEIRSKINISKGKKLVLFAPTYRKIMDNYFNDSVAIMYGIDSEKVCNALKTRFGGEWEFAIRYHPCVTNRDQFDLDGMLDLTDYEDVQDLLLVADVLITDFSSIMWDFMLTKKPCFIFAVDMVHYIKTSNIYIPISEWPFPKADNNDVLINNIIHFDREKYLKDCTKHYEQLGGCENGNATQLVCEKINELCLNNE